MNEHPPTYHPATHPSNTIIRLHHPLTVPAAPAVGADDAVQGDFSTNRRGKHGFGAVGHDLGVDLALTLEDAEDGRLAARATPGLALDATRAKVRLIDLDDARELTFHRTGFGQSQTDAGKQTVHGFAVQAGELGDLDSGQVGGHVPQEPTELVLGKS